MMVIENTYDIGDMVYLKTDADQRLRIVFSVKVFKSGELMYELVCGTITSIHYEFEISKEKDLTNAI